MNSELIQLQNDLYKELKNVVTLANNFINLCKNLFEDYAKENSTRLYSFLDCDFIRNDLNFLLSEIENNCLPELNIIYKNYILLSIISILFSFIFLIFYSITSYQPIKNEIEEKVKILLKDEIEKKIREKSNSKIGFMNNGYIQRNKVYNTIIYQNQQNENVEKKDNLLQLNHNNFNLRTTKHHGITNVNIDNSKEVL